METRDSRLESSDSPLQRSRQELGDQQQLDQKGRMLTGEHLNTASSASGADQIRHTEQSARPENQLQTECDDLVKEYQTNELQTECDVLVKEYERRKGLSGANGGKGDEDYIG